jgi:hypothetical protein
MIEWFLKNDNFPDPIEGPGKFGPSGWLGPTEGMLAEGEEGGGVQGGVVLQDTEMDVGAYGGFQ